MPVDMQLVTEYLQRKNEKSELERQMRAVQDWLNETEQVLLEQFVQEGTQSVKIKGLGTAFIRSQLWAGPVKDENGESNYELSCEAFRAAGLPMFVQERFNTQTVSAWVRELPKDEQTGEPILPDELKGKLTITEQFKVATRNA